MWHPYFLHPLEVMPGPSNQIETEKICISMEGLHFPVTVSSYRAFVRATLPMDIQPTESPGSLDLEANCLHKLSGKIFLPNTEILLGEGRFCRKLKSLLQRGERHW